MTDAAFCEALDAYRKMVLADINYPNSARPAQARARVVEVDDE